VKPNCCPCRASTPQGEGRRGRLSHDEQNLIRAALAFAGAGLDSALKQLVRDTLPILIESELGVERMFKKLRS